MSDEIYNRFSPDRLRLDISEQRAVEPARIQKRRKHLEDADGQTYRVALFVCYESWRSGNEAIKVPNGMLEMDGVPPESKRRALRDLERRGCITVKWRPSKSPIVRLLA